MVPCICCTNGSYAYAFFLYVSVSGAPPQTPLGNLRRSLRPLVVRSILPSAIAASRFWRLQFPRLTCLYAKNSNPWSESTTPVRIGLQCLHFHLHYVPLLQIP